MNRDDDNEDYDEADVQDAVDIVCEIFKGAIKGKVFLPRLASEQGYTVREYVDRVLKPIGYDKYVEGDYFNMCKDTDKHEEE